MASDYYGPMQIYVKHHRPEPNQELEAKVRAQLKSLDELLDVLWVPNAVFNERAGDWEGRYCLICRWPQIDSRWSMYQSGEIGEPFDALGWFCSDMSDPESVPVQVDSIENKVIELLGKCDNTRQHWKSRMKDAIEKNAKLRRDRKAKMADATHEMASTLFQAVGRHDEVTVQRIMKEAGESYE